VAALTPLLELALNGARTRSEHAAVPRTPEELARDARDAVAAGARILHLHPYDAEGRETLEAGACAAAIGAVRAACSVPISLSTSADIEPDPERRRDLVAGWTVLPDLVTANQGEAGIRELCRDLFARGVGIEAGLLSVADAEAFVESGLVALGCARVLVEPLDADPADAVAHAAAMEEVLARAAVGLEQVHHGEGVASWAVNERGLARGHGIRTGLEDTTVLPDGRPAEGNGELARVAAEMIARHAQN
jgi:uncharacterized protein (DUF849 family)